MSHAFADIAFTPAVKAAQLIDGSRAACARNFERSDGATLNQRLGPDEANPLGQVPVLDDDGTIVFDSNAILVYLAARFDPAGRWLPRDAKGQAEVQQWFSVAAGPIAFGPAAARLITVFGAKYNAENVIARAHALLRVMEARLSRRDFLVGASATLADVAGYSYLSAAPEGNVDLSAYPNVRSWLARIEALPGFVAFRKTPVGLAA